jgi:two-component system response regulator DegU
MTIKVLIADDHPIVRSGIRSEFAQHQDILVVGEAVDGNEVLPLANELQPDVLVLDINMPGMKAINILKAIKVQNPSIAVLILSAYGDPENVIGMLKGGARGYILKDTDPGEIVTGVRAVYSGKNWVDSSVINVLVGQKDQTQLMPDITVLSAREFEVLKMVGQGANNEGIAKALSISESTVKNHLTNIYEKLGFHSRAEVVAWIWKIGIF